MPTTCATSIRLAAQGRGRATRPRPLVALSIRFSCVVMSPGSMRVLSQIRFGAQSRRVRDLFPAFSPPLSLAMDGPEPYLVALSHGG